MSENRPQNEKQSQLGKFKELARELEADEDEAHWDERLKKVAKAKSVAQEPKRNR